MKGALQQVLLLRAILNPGKSRELFVLHLTNHSCLLMGSSRSSICGHVSGGDCRRTAKWSVRMNNSLKMTNWPSSSAIFTLKNRALLIQEEKTIGGQLGRPSSARYRAYMRLNNYLQQMKKTAPLLIPKELERTLDDIYRYPLRSTATDTLNRQQGTCKVRTPLMKKPSTPSPFSPKAKGERQDSFFIGSHVRVVHGDSPPAPHASGARGEIRWSGFPPRLQSGRGGLRG